MSTVYCNSVDLSAHIASANDESLIANDNRQATLDQVCLAASRAVDQHCGRVFYSQVSSARVYATGDPWTLRVDDFYGTPTIATDTSGNGTFDQTWATTDYQLEPLNGVWNGRPGFPRWRVQAIDSRTFPCAAQARVQVTATWGWESIPDDVVQATLMLGHRLLDRVNAPEGIMGFGEFGAVRVLQSDPDVRMLLNDFRRDAYLVT